MKLKKICSILKINTNYLNFDKDIDIYSVSDDSRNTKKKDLYISLKKNQNNSHDYLKEAIGKGCKVVFSDYQIESSLKKEYKKVFFLKVKDLEKKIPLITNSIYKNPSRRLKITAVTGTNGKTSVTHFSHQILKIIGDKSAVIGTNGYGELGKLKNSGYTTPRNVILNRTLSELKKLKFEKVYLEASSHALEQERLKDINIENAVFTNLTHDHLDYHKNMKNYFNAKRRLFEDFDIKNAVINVDTQYGEKLAKKIDRNIKLLTFSNKKKTANAYIKNYKLNENGIDFVLDLGVNQIKCSLNLYGFYNIENLSLAILNLINQGYSPKEIEKSLKKLKPVKGRMECVYNKKNKKIFVDYAHTPISIEISLRSLKEHFPESKIACVLGCGGDRDRTKRSKMGKLAHLNSNRLYVTNDNPRNEDENKIFQQIIEKISNKKNIDIIADRRSAIKNAIYHSNCELVVIFGKGHEEYQILKNNTIRFNDRRIVKDIMDKL